MRRTKRKYKIKWQMIAVYVAVAVIPVLIIGTLAVFMLRGQMTRSFEIQLDAESSRVRSILFDITSSVYSFCEPVVSVQAYRNVLAAEHMGDNERTVYHSLTRAISSLRESTAAISSIGIYTDNPELPSNAYIFSTADFDAYEWYRKTGPDVWEKWVYTTVQVNRLQQDEELTLVRRINIGSVKYRAYLVITISANHLRNRTLTTDSFIMVSMDDFNCIFSSLYKAEEESMPLSENVEENYYNYIGPYEIDGRKTLTKTSSFNSFMTGDRFYILVSDTDAYEQIDHLTMMLVLIVTFAFASLSSIIFLFSNSFSQRVEMLRTAMHRASLGDYDIADEFRGTDELAETFEDLKTMVTEVREKEARYYEARLEEQRFLRMQREMEFKMLSSQINPHFLYNTLELIRMQALSRNDREVAQSILLLARSMHYVLENTGLKDAALEDELEYVAIYLQIQKQRFGDRVNWDFYLDESIDRKHYPILPLLIQPVVENAIIHGLENMQGGGHISIILEKDNKELSITVRDNGAGIAPEHLAKLRESLEKDSNDDGSSIGLFNINQRIKARYGNEYGVQIKSVLFNGTSVTLILPAEPENREEYGGQTDQCSDCGR